MTPRRAAYIALILATVLAPVVGLGAFVRATVAADVAARSASDRVHDAQLASQLLSADLTAAGQDVGYLVSRPEVRQALRTRDATALGSELTAFERSSPQYTAIIALDPAGNELAIGTPAGPVEPTAGASDRSDRDYFTGALASTSTYVSEAYMPARAGLSSLVAVSEAVRDGDTVLGVIALTLSPGSVIDEVAKAASEPGRVILVVDRSSHVVASTSPTIAPLSTVRLDTVGPAVAGASGSTQAPFERRQRVVTYVPVAGAHWALYIIDDPSVVLAVEHTLETRIAVGAAGALFATLALAVALVILYLRFARRTDELARSRLALQASNEQLELANRHKSEFLSSVSHELRTPMNAILGFTDLLDEQLRPAITERQQRYFRNIREAGDHLLDLINDVLDLSRVETGRIDLRPETVTVVQLLEPVIANARRSSAEHGIAFSDETADGLVRLDPSRIRQVLYNLTSNALKFTPEGGRVECRARIDGTDLVIEVSDTGIGIPADRQERVFGMFERVNEDRSRAKGTGLGLALSKRIVELHGGVIGFTSVPDAGSTFWVRLPGVVQTAPPEGRAADLARTAG